jgi:hypothetical protein
MSGNAQAAALGEPFVFLCVVRSRAELKSEEPGYTTSPSV